MSTPTARSGQPAALGALVVIALAAACFGIASATAAAPAPTPTIKGSQLPTDKSPFTPAGTVVSAATLFTPRDFVNANDGFALTSLNSGGGAQYPAVTTDGGKVWKVGGPHFHVDAANAPAAVDAVGVAGRSTYFAYGGPYGGQVVNVSTNGGKTWWGAYLPGAVEAVVQGNVGGKSELIAFLEGSPTWVYVSANGGHTWTYSKSQLT